jgi:hypothetical protein
MTIMPIDRLSNDELILHVDNMTNPSPLEKLLADRLSEVIRERDAAMEDVESCGPR